MGISLVLAFALALPAGIVAALKPRSWYDYALNLFAFAGISMPSFWLALLLILLFAVELGWLPASGVQTVGVERFGDRVAHLVLPVLTLTVLTAGGLLRFVRAAMLEALRQDYVRTARAKGLTERRVRMRHVLRNALIPIVTIFGLDFGAVLGGGDLVIESIFNIHGVGYFAATALSNQDLPPILAVTLLGAFFIVFFNALVDIAYAYLDPRIRLGTEAPAAA
jgi:peptide/nickel transport system permease protein